MNKLSKRFVVLLFMSLVYGLTQDNVEAASKTVTKYNFLSGIATHGNMSTVGTANQATCNIVSYTSPSTTINVIGWTWWQCNIYTNNGVMVYSGGSRAVTNSSTSQSLSIQIPAHIQVRGFGAEGVHDFNHSGASPSPWRPYNSVTH
jgi:hypothetical protein